MLTAESLQEQFERIAGIDRDALSEVTGLASLGKSLAECYARDIASQSWIVDATERLRGFDNKLGGERGVSALREINETRDPFH